MFRAGDIIKDVEYDEIFYILEKGEYYYYFYVIKSDWSGLPKLDFEHISAVEADYRKIY